MHEIPAAERICELSGEGAAPPRTELSTLNPAPTMGLGPKPIMGAGFSGIISYCLTMIPSNGKQ